MNEFSHVDALVGMVVEAELAKKARCPDAEVLKLRRKALDALEEVGLGIRAESAGIDEEDMRRRLLLNLVILKASARLDELKNNN